MNSCLFFPLYFPTVLSVDFFPYFLFIRCSLLLFFCLCTFHFYFVIPSLAPLISCISPFFFYVNFKCIPETEISKKMKRRKRITKGGRKGKDYLEGIVLIQLSQNNQVMSIRRKIYTAWHASVFLFRYISIAMTNSSIFIFF